MTTVAFDSFLSYVGALDFSHEQLLSITKFFADLKEKMTKEKKAKKKKPSNKDIIMEKFKNVKISPEIKALEGIGILSEEDMDERSKYILSK